MDSSTYQRAAVSAGLWFAFTYGVSVVFGTVPSISNVALDSAIMAASSIGSDAVHNTLQWQSSGVSSAVATGALFAAGQRAVRGDAAYVMNAALGAANTFAVEKWWDYQQQLRYQAAMEEASAEGL
jgi:hypothetical protein